MHKNQKAWWVLLVVAAIIKIIAEFPELVEKYYSNGLFPVISKAQRLLLGWIPVSVGDLCYGLAGLFLLFRLFRFLKTVVQRKSDKQYWWNGIRWLFFWGLMVYVVFNILWGLNYNRLGIKHQLALDMKPYSISDLDTVMKVIVNRLYQYDSAGTAQRNRHERFDTLYTEAIASYRTAQQHFAWLHYGTPSLKPSLFSLLGNYLGYTGYYNPFSGEGQVNIRVPLFVQPFTTCHEIGHQLGYAKENEANFAAYLSAKSSPEASVRYSLYFDLYHYGIRELLLKDSVRARQLHSQVPQQVKADFAELKRFNEQYQNPVEPYIRNLYGQYLMANEQPGGMQSYSEVMAFLIAYYNKYGQAAL